MMEFYNSFPSNFMKQKIFGDYDRSIKYHVFETKDFSSNFSNFDYIRRIANEMKNVKMEELKFNREKPSKTKSITCLSTKSQALTREKKLDLLIKSEKREEIKFSQNSSNSEKLLNENFSKISNFNIELKQVNLELKYAYDFKKSLNFPKRKGSSPNENFYKLKRDIRQSQEVMSYSIKKSNQKDFNCNNKIKFDNHQNNNNCNINLKNKKVNFSIDINRQKNENNFDGINNTSNKNNKNEKLKINEKVDISFVYLENNRNNTFDCKAHNLTEEQKNELEAYLIQKIIQVRKNSVNLIIKNYKIYKENQIKKKEALLKEIVRERKDSSIRIQSAFRSFYIRKNIKEILDKLEENYIFIYDYNRKYFQKKKKSKVNIYDSTNSSSSSNSTNINDSYNTSNGILSPIDIEEEAHHDIKLKLINKKSKHNEVLNFKYSKFLKCYLLIFKKKGLIRRTYKVNFIVNGNIIIDPRFKLDADEDGKFYNVIESHMLMIRNKIKNYENKLKFPNYLFLNSSTNASSHGQISAGNSLATCDTNNTAIKGYIFEKGKYWEDIFKIKINTNYRSVYTNSVSDGSETHEFDRIFLMKKGIYSASSPCTTNRPTLKPILKKLNSDSSVTKKSVSFSENVQISFFQI